MTYALKYLETQKLKKYIAWGIIAGLFHYSALVIVPLFVLVASMSNKNVKEFRFFKGIAIATLVTPTVFLLGINIFQRIFKGFSWFGRYSKYFDLNTISIRVLKNVVWILPLLLILILYGRYLEKRMSSFKLHANLVLVMMSIAVISVVFGVQRLIYYIYPSAFYLYSAVLELPFKTGEKKKIKLFFWVGITIMGLVWMLVVIIGGDNWNKFMIPYSIYIK
jgi:hypothetical protein